MGAFEKQPRSTLSSTFHQVLAPGYSLLAMPLDATDNRVPALFAGLTQPGFSVFKIDGNGIRASSFLNGHWSDPDLTLSPGEAWFFKNPYSSGFAVDISGFIPTGTLIKSLPPGISACSSIAEVGGGVHTTLLFPLPLAMDPQRDVCVWNGAGYDCSSCWRGSWTPSEPVIAIGQSFVTHIYDSGVDWGQVVDSSGDLTGANNTLNAWTAWPDPGGYLNFLTYSANDPTPHQVYMTDGTTPLDGNYLGQLYGSAISSDQSTFAALGTPVPFSGGYISSGAIQVPGTIQGQTLWVHLRCWKASDGATFEQALTTGHPVGVSEMMTRILGGGLPSLSPAGC